MKTIISVLFGVLLFCNSVFSQYCPKGKYKVPYRQFTVDWDTINRIPHFVYYKVEKSKLGGFGRYNFGTDPKLLNPSYSGEYSGSRYDIGHLFPAASANSTKACSDSFWLTNMAPMLPEYNRGIWKSLESFERYASDSIIYIVTGPIIDQASTKISGTNITVPTKYFKVMYNPKWGLMIAFIIPQKFNYSEPLRSYVVTVDEVEKITKIDFFPQLEDKLEGAYERESNYWYWY